MQKGKAPEPAVRGGEMLKKHIFDAQSRIELIAQGKAHIVIDTPAPFVKRITLNRPECHNLLANETRAALFDQLQINDQDPDCRVTVVRGAGGHFCAGYEIADRKTALPSFTSDADGQQQRNNLEGWFMINDLAKPVISSVEGECLGGGMELAAACDIVLVTTDAMIGYPPVRGQGLPDYQIYPWLMGHRNAMEVMLTNRQMNGEEAVERGFATACFNPDELEVKTLEFANRVAKIPADLLAFNKRSVHRAFEAMGMRTNLRNGVDLETLMFKAPGAKMLTARRPAARPGEPRAPPPRPNSSLPAGSPAASKPVASLLATASSSAVNGPVVGASAVSANAAAAAPSTPAPKAAEPSAGVSAAAPQTPVAKAAAPRASTPAKAQATGESPAKPVGPKRAVEQKAAPEREDKVESVSASETPKPAPAAKTPKAAPAATAAAAPKSAPAKVPVAAKAPATPPKTPAKAAPSTPAAATPKTEAKAAPSTPAAKAAAPKAPATPKAAASSTPSKAPVITTKAAGKTPAAEEEDGVHVHINEAINIHFHKTPSKL